MTREFFVALFGERVVMYLLIGVLMPTFDVCAEMGNAI
jgi:hypothetical protein